MSWFIFKNIIFLMVSGRFLAFSGEESASHPSRSARGSAPSSGHNVKISMASIERYRQSGRIAFSIHFNAYKHFHNMISQCWFSHVPKQNLSLGECFAPFHASHGCCKSELQYHMVRITPLQDWGWAGPKGESGGITSTVVEKPCFVDFGIQIKLTRQGPQYPLIKQRSLIRYLSLILF